MTSAGAEHPKTPESHPLDHPRLERERAKPHTLEPEEARGHSPAGSPAPSFVKVLKETGWANPICHRQVPKSELGTERT